MFGDEIEMKKNQFDPRIFFLNARFVMACTRFTLDSVLVLTQKQEKSVMKIDIFHVPWMVGSAKKLLKFLYRCLLGMLKRKNPTLTPEILCELRQSPLPLLNNTALTLSESIKRPS